MSWLHAALTVAVLTLAGCGAPADNGGPDEEKPLADNKGGINGLLIDDVYRPIRDAKVILTPVGVTAITNANGEFRFRDLDPVTYTILVEADGHEAAPMSTDVVAGIYVDAHVEARRLLSDGGRVVTLQYSAFIPCAASTPVASTVHGYCFFDGSGDTYRAGLEGLDFKSYNNESLTFMVGEARINQPDHYVLVVREDNGQSFGGEEYGRGLTEGGEYARFVLERGANYMGTDNSAVWNNTKRMEVILFYYGPGGDEVSGVLTPTWCNSGLPDVNNPQSGRPLVGCREYYGVGHKMGIKANIILTLFLGEPTEDVGTYAVLRP